MRRYSSVLTSGAHVGKLPTANAPARQLPVAPSATRGASRRPLGAEIPPPRTWNSARPNQEACHRASTHGAAAGHPSDSLQHNDHGIAKIVGHASTGFHRG